MVLCNLGIGISRKLCTYGFLDKTRLESGAKFAGTIKNGCYFCRLNNRTRQSCGPLQEYKRLDIAAKNTDDSTLSTKANIAKEVQQDTMDLDTNDISNINITNYVDSTLNTISTNYDSVLSCKPTKSYFTSHKSNLKYVDNSNNQITTQSSKTNDNITQTSNIFTTKKVEIFLIKEKYQNQAYHPNITILTKSTYTIIL